MKKQAAHIARACFYIAKVMPKYSNENECKKRSLTAKFI
jgi:hypothetical protein